MPERRPHSTRARAWVWMYHQVFGVADSRAELTEDADHGEPLGGPPDDRSGGQ
jgi:hypothetical protein